MRTCAALARPVVSRVAMFQSQLAKHVPRSIDTRGYPPVRPAGRWVPDRRTDEGNHVANATVYVVDDDVTVRQSIEFLLSSYAIRNQCFAGGQAFLDALPELAPGCVLLDLRMPRPSGLDIQRELAACGSRFSVIMMTGDVDDEAEAYSIQLGAVDVLHKPFAEEALLASLKAGFARLSDRARADRKSDPPRRLRPVT